MSRRARNSQKDEQHQQISSEAGKPHEPLSHPTTVRQEPHEPYLVDPVLPEPRKPSPCRQDSSTFSEQPAPAPQGTAQRSSSAARISRRESSPLTPSQRRQLHDEQRRHTSPLHLPEEQRSSQQQRGPTEGRSTTTTSSSSPLTEGDQSTLPTQSAVARTTTTDTRAVTSPHPDSDEIVIDVATAGSSPPQLVGFSDSVRSPSFTAQQTNNTNNNSMSTEIGGAGGPGSNNGTSGIDERPLLGTAGSTSEAQHSSPLVYGSLDTTAATTPDAGGRGGSSNGGGYRATERGVPPPPLTSMTHSDDADGDSGSPRSSRYPYTVAIVNPLSGERSAAEYVFQSLCDDLGPHRVLKLSREIFQDPRAIRLLIERAVRRDGMRGTVVVSGGDGTVAFVMSQIDVLAEANGMDSIVVVDGVGALSPVAADDVEEGNGLLMMPAVAVLALGTGNDFSNCMGFGNGYTKHKVCCMCVCCVNHVNSLLDAVTSAPATPFDRWVASIVPFSDSNPSAPSAPPPPAPFVKPPREVIFMNYFSFGMDAFIATHFDKLRKRFPSCFQYRFQNKGWYGGLGIYGWAKSGRLNPLVSKLQLLINPAIMKATSSATNATTTAAPPPTAAASTTASNMLSSVLPPKTKALVISNVNSYSGGTVLWHPGADNGAKYCMSKTPSRVYINDKQLEIQAIGGLVDMTMLQMKIGSGADKIAQAKEIRVSIGSPNAAGGLKNVVPLQADGEPIGCLTEGAEIHIRLYPRQIYVRCANSEVVRRADPMNIVQLL
jgi:hypothetical protein